MTKICKFCTNYSNDSNLCFKNSDEFNNLNSSKCKHFDDYDIYAVHGLDYRYGDIGYNSF